MQLPQSVLSGNFQKARSVFTWEHYHDPLNLGRLLEFLQRMDDYGNACEFQKLLCAPSAHSTSLPGGGDDRDIHNFEYY